MSEWQRLDETEALPARRLDRPPVALVLGDHRGSEVPALRLVSLTGARIVQIHQRSAVIGRHSSADVQILEADISRRHCRLFYADDDWYVEDLGSLNGTLVNAEPITETPLRSNDLLHVGGQRFRVKIGPEESPGAGQVELGHRDQVLRSIARILAEDEGVDRRHGAAA